MFHIAESLATIFAVHQSNIVMGYIILMNIPILSDNGLDDLFLDLIGRIQTDFLQRLKSLSNAPNVNSILVLALMLQVPQTPFS